MFIEGFCEEMEKRAVERMNYVHYPTGQIRQNFSGSSPDEMTQAKKLGLYVWRDTEQEAIMKKPRPLYVAHRYIRDPYHQQLALESIKRKQRSKKIKEGLKGGGLLGAAGIGGLAALKYIKPRI